MGAHIKLRIVLLSVWVLMLSATICYVTYMGVLMQMYLTNGRALVRKTKPYSQHKKDTLNILIIGDSLAYGVGASRPELSFAGQIGALYPDATIENKAVVGENTLGLVESLHNVLTHRYDMIFMIVGANDVSHYKVDITHSKTHLATLYKRLSAMADRVYTYTSCDFAQISAAPTVFRDYYSQRSHILRDESIRLAARYKNITYIDTFSTHTNGYKSLEAADGFHLNDQGIHLLINATFAHRRI